MRRLGALSPFSSSSVYHECGDRIFQDVFDHDKGLKSVISGRNLQWILLNFLLWICPFFSRSSVHFSKEIAPNVERIA